MRGLILAAAVSAAAVIAGPARADFESYALVQGDGSLRVSGRTVVLHGIYIPRTGRTCRVSVRPVRCSSEAALALELRIQSFVRCHPVGRLPDGAVEAICTVKGEGSVLEPDEDLAAYLLRRGLAVAAPEAPFEYVTLERIARAQGRGLWSDRFRQLR